jgi:hypothetical protein
MKYIQGYKLFESRDGLTRDQRKFLDEYAPGRWSVNREGIVNVRGSVYCHSQGLGDFLGIRFGEVIGSFRCYANQLRTLEGSPRKVGGNFSCFSNQLRTLEGSPREVVGGFYCFRNQLRTLEGSPRVVGGHFNCSENLLISLEGAPEVIEGHFCFKNTWFSYDLRSFLNEIDRIKPDEISLILTHHFFTPEVIKEQITKNPDFPYYVSLAWNTEGFKKTQDELKKILPQNILVKIDDLWSIGGYL